MIRPLVRRVFEKVDQRYHRTHQLKPVGPLLLIGRQRYEGPEKQFPDGTVLKPGDMLGELHFNNARLSRMNATSSVNAGLGFARLMFASLHRLSAQAPDDPHLSDLAVYHGVTWLRPHGSSVGFTTEPLQGGLGRRLKMVYFRLLLWAFSANPTGPSPVPDPHHYWLTRESLRHNFRPAAKDSASVSRASRPPRSASGTPIVSNTGA